MRIIFVSLALLALCHCLGCVSLPMKYHGAVSAMNRSDTDIRFVIVDSGRGENRFGFLGAGGAGKTRSGCAVDNLKDVTISWSENGASRTAVLDVSAYSKSVSGVVDMTFCYMGKGRWTVGIEMQ